MRFRLPLLVGALCCFAPLSAHAAVMEICNEGNVDLDVARAAYSQSLFFGNSYHVEGWYAVEPGKCTAVYSETSPDDLYLGFAFRDVNHVLRTHVSTPHADADLQAVSEHFCVAIGQVFDYTTRSKGGSCQAGFEPLEFSLFMRFTGGNFGRVTYSVKPSRFDTDGAPIGGLPEVAQLMFGDKVYRTGSTWQRANGARLADNYINPRTSLPPLAPRVQYSAAQAPVAGYVQQIVNVLAGVTVCRWTGSSIRPLRFSLDDRGVAFTSYNQDSSRDRAAMALADMDLAAASPSDVYRQRDGDCWELEIKCKGGGYCGEHDRLDGSATSVFDLYTNTREQAATILEALKRIAPYYPDPAPEIRRPK